MLASNRRDVAGLWRIGGRLAAAAACDTVPFPGGSATGLSVAGCLKVGPWPGDASILLRYWARDHNKDCKLGLGGIVSKKLDGPYKSGH
jgi:hypothetical protein